MTAWDESYDLVIVGSGGGGLAAALAAVDDGLRPIVLEKQEKLGGSTAMSGGVLWIPANPLLGEAGVADSLEAGLEYFEAVVGDVGPASSIERRRTFIESGGDLVRLLRRKGVRFEHADGYSDYYSNLPGGVDRGRSIEPKPYDAKKLGPWRDKLVPGMAKHLGFVLKTNEMRVIQYFNRSLRTFVHAGWVFARTWGSRILGKDLLTNGASLVAQMLASLLASEVPVRLGTALTDLIVEDGRVRGVRVTHDGTSTTIEARRGVLLAAGGFGHNAELRAAVSGAQPTDGRWSVANPGDTGEVLQLAMALGAQTDLLDEAWWLPSTRRELAGSTIAQARQRPGAILVDNDGKRFANEANSMVEVSKAMFARGAVPCWAIMDEGYRKRYTNGVTLPGYLPTAWIENGWVKKADTLEGLAAQIGVPADGLVETVREFNVHAAHGRDPQFGRGESAYNRAMGDPGYRPNPALGPLTRAPYYAAEIFPADVGTCGGLITDEHARVLREDGQAIPGLYATGNITASVMGRAYLGAGGSIASTMVFGYVAARHVAQAEAPVGT